MSDENNEDKNKLGDFLRKGVRGLRDRMTYDITDLIGAVNKSDTDQVARVLYAGVGPNGRDGINRRALPMAVENNHVEIVKMLLKAKADPNLPGSDGDLPLRKAVYWESESITLMLLEAGARKDLPNREGVSAMLEATRNGYQSMIDLMEDFKNPERVKQIARDKAKHAAQKRKIEAVKAEQSEEAKKVVEAAEEKKTKAVESLEEKYKVEEKGYFESMMEAILAKDPKATKVFIDKTENLNQISEKGTTPLLEAVRSKHMKLATYLLDKEADPFQYAPLQKHSPFSRAVLDETIEFIEITVDRYPEKVAEQCNDEEQMLSPQFLAYKNAKLFNLLLSAGANAAWGGTEGTPPVVKAMKKGSVAILPVLVRNKFDLDQLVDGKTLLEWAVTFNRMDWVNGLLEEEVDLSVPTSEGETALELAKRLGDRDAIVGLLEEEE
ncbi:MAG: ankyrin repeat protein [Patescibacteria group bacterium]|jgi:ankyrin repeat protein